MRVVCHVGRPRYGSVPARPGELRTVSLNSNYESGCEIPNEISIGAFPRPLLRFAATRYYSLMDQLTTSMVGINFPNENKSKSNLHMFRALGELVELRLEPKNPYSQNEVAVFNDHGFVGDAYDVHWTGSRGASN